MKRTFVVVGVVAGCGGGVQLGASEAKPAVTAAPADVVVELPGEANGIVWDAATSTLYLTDNTAGAIASWTDAAGFATVATLPAAEKNARSAGSCDSSMARSS